MKDELKRLEAFEHEEDKLPDKEVIIKTVQHWFDSGMNGSVLDLFPVVKHLSMNGVNRLKLYLVHIIVFHCREYPQNPYNDRMIFEAVESLSIKEQKEVIGIK
jgi:hypothetical protein